MLRAAIDQQIDLITHWMRVGFIHGVMNTDNMALSGETIDYGPCAFMDAFSPDTVFSSIDHRGRYAFANQPYAAQWNLARLAESLLPLIHDERQDAIAGAEESLERVRTRLQRQVARHDGNQIRARRGGQTRRATRNRPVGLDAFERCRLHQYLPRSGQAGPSRESTLPKRNLRDLASSLAGTTWWGGTKFDSLSLMRSVNPVVIPRNHKVEEALQAGEEGNLNPFRNL